MFFNILRKLSKLALFGPMFQGMLPLSLLMNGNDGDVTIGGTSQAVKSWTLNLEADEIETTNGTDASDAQSFLAGRVGGTFSWEAYSNDNVADQVAGTSAAFILVAKQGTSTDKSWIFTGIINSVQVVTNIPAGDAVLVTGSGRISGAVTVAQFADV